MKITKSICPECRSIIEAKIFDKNNKVYMKKKCKEHGNFSSLIFSDAKLYHRIKKYNKPGKKPKKFVSQVKKNCPYDCGICSNHKQHTCLGIIEITNSCNQNCKTCFADSNGFNFLSIKKINEMLDILLECENNLEVLQISGGEPTLHPKIVEILKLANSKNFKSIMLNTNGKRIANDIGFVKDLAKIKPTIYLQFDGFDRETYMKLRGEDLREVKDKAIKNLEKEGHLPVILVATLQRGVNEHEIGKIIDFVLKKPLIKGVSFQPTTYCNRYPNYDPMDIVTIPEVIEEIEKQTNKRLLKSDFYPIPCPYPSCSFISYVFIKSNNELSALPRIIDIDDYLDFFTNKFMPDFNKVIQKAVNSLYSTSAVPGTEKIVRAYCEACSLDFNFKQMEDKIKVISIMHFMDPYTFDLERTEKCCIHEVMPDGKMIPFCVYNNIYRRKNEY